MWLGDGRVDGVSMCCGVDWRRDLRAVGEVE